MGEVKKKKHGVHWGLALTIVVVITAALQYGLYVYFDGNYQSEPLLLTQGFTTTMPHAFMDIEYKVMFGIDTIWIILWLLLTGRRYGDDGFWYWTTMLGFALYRVVGFWYSAYYQYNLSYFSEYSGAEFPGVIVTGLAIVYMLIVFIGCRKSRSVAESLRIAEGR